MLESKLPKEETKSLITAPLESMSLPKTLPMKTSAGEIPVPVVGFGTWAAGDTNWCYEATLAALQAGCRHLDCAWHYGVKRSPLSSLFPRRQSPP